MGIHVSWGKSLPCYDEKNKQFNSLKNQWDRYSENLKRGWVLYSSNVLGYNGFQLTFELMNLEELRWKGFESLKKNPKRNIKKEIMEIYGDGVYNQWGMNGDDFSPSNNPYDLNQIKKENEELSKDELNEENEFIVQRISELKRDNSEKNNLKIIEWWETQLGFNKELIEKKFG